MNSEKIKMADVKIPRIPHIKLEREGSLPRIELSTPSTPTTPTTPRKMPVYPSSGTGMANKSSSYSPSIPPNTKKLRMRSFLWVKPVDTTGSVTSGLFAQLLPVLVVNIGALSSGLAMGYSAILLPQIRPDYEPLEDLVHHKYNFTSTNYRPFTADQDQGSWIASIFGIGAVFGGLTSAALGSKYGRRVCIIMLSLVDLLGWILMAGSQSLSMMLCGRFLAGFVAAGYSPCIQIYVAEITQAKNRGWMSGLTVPIMSIGTLIMYTLGSYVPWHVAAAVCAPVPVALGFAVCFLYESPYWYFQQGEEKSAYHALEKFRGKSENCVSESFQIQEHLKGEEQEMGVLQSLKSIFGERKYFRPFLILNTLFLFMLFSGKFAIEFYAVDIFTKAGGQMDKYLSAVIIAIIQLVGSLMFLPLVRLVSRKILICTSSFIMGTALVVLGLSMYSKVSGSMMSSFSELDWLPLVSVVVYMVAAPIGLCSIPFMYIAEFYPSQLRSVLGGLTIALSNLELFVVVKTFPDLQRLVGDHGVYWIYAGACFLAIVFTVAYVPETKDKSLIQVENKFDRLRRTHRASPWVSPMPSPSVNSVRKLQFQSQMFTQ